MGVKRSHAESSGGNDGAAAAGAPKRFKGRKHPHHQHKKHQTDPNEDSMTSIKKRARAIERTLAKKTTDDAEGGKPLPANVQRDLERELAAHRQRIAEHAEKQARSRMISKYHMVRFFERKKAMRLAKQLQKQLTSAADPQEVERLKADLHIAEVDIDYARYFPFMEKYVALYGNASAEKKEKVAQKKGKQTDEEKEQEEAEKKAAAQLALHSERPPLWKLVEKTREEGTEALEKLQNRRLDKDGKELPPIKWVNKAGPKHNVKGSIKPVKGAGPQASSANNIPLGKTRVITRAERREVQEEEEDGGFFEED